MPTDLITRLQAGDGDNAEVLRALGWEERPYCWARPDGEIVWKAYTPQPLTSVDDALRLLGEGWEFSAATWDPDEGIVVRLWKKGIGHVSGKCAGYDRIKALRIALVCAILRTKETPSV